MSYQLLPDGWFANAARYTIKPRQGSKEIIDAKGKRVIRPLYLDAKGQKTTTKTDKPYIFCPLTVGLHPDFKSPRGVTIHCTVVILEADVLARRTATTSGRESSYNLLIGLAGDLHQLASIRDRTWHAGRGPITAKSAYFNRTVTTRWASSAKQTVARDNAWRWPVVDGRVVINPNNWGPGIELMGLPGRPTAAQQQTLANVLKELYLKTDITPDAVWAHGDLDPLHRSDPGWPELYAFAAAVGRDEKLGDGLGFGGADA